MQIVLASRRFVNGQSGGNLVVDAARRTYEQLPARSLAPPYRTSGGTPAASVEPVESFVFGGRQRPMRAHAGAKSIVHIRTDVDAIAAASTPNESKSIRLRSTRSDFELAWQAIGQRSKAWIKRSLAGVGTTNRESTRARSFNDRGTFPLLRDSKGIAALMPIYGDFRFENSLL
jgi:hypothetical protein